ncbi:hypothetical protein J7E70_18350 [Variovorax paradoxus]|nr:hypothetical protein [Variovorax paradoxus]MBT2302423.1 hypothetical protein [Variovorax paradoxus]
MDHKLMKTKYAIWIGGDVKYFDAQRNPSEGFPPVAGGGEPPILMWPLVDLDVTKPEWDEALADYTMELREKAEVRIVAE